MGLKEKVYRMGFLPEVMSLVAIGKSVKGQSSLEYIMMLSAASIVILIALAMIVKLKSAAVFNTTVNGTSTSVSNAIMQQLSSLSKNV